MPYMWGGVVHWLCEKCSGPAHDRHVAASKRNPAKLLARAAKALEDSRSHDSRHAKLAKDIREYLETTGRSPSASR